MVISLLQYFGYKTTRYANGQRVFEPENMPYGNNPLTEPEEQALASWYVLIHKLDTYNETCRIEK